MRFLVNMNLPRQVCPLLRAQGHECRHVADIGLACATDPEIVAVARDSGEAILTHDLDYGQIVRFSGLSSPSVVIIRFREIGSESIAERLAAVWREISAPPDEGAVVSLTARSVRVHRLVR